MTHFELFKTGQVAFFAKSQRERTAIARVFNCDSGLSYSSHYPYISQGNGGLIGNARPEPFVVFESLTDFFSTSPDKVLGEDVTLRSKRVVKVFKDFVKVGQFQFTKEELAEMLEKVSK